ncbi:MAG: dihydrofolate reductase family protein [Alistipes sp.]|nr:dihydrofolate reductase family protein [Alistipes senegalensis]MCM1250433.1 dihydrofolate reductase family protein [Alistipes sp.]
MLVTLSVAVTADGYMDDRSPERLLVSTPEDLAEVYRLRAEHDAILVGAETLRRDDPALLLRDPAARLQRIEKGLRPDLTKVTLTQSGALDPKLRFFTEGDADIYVFATRDIPALKDIATVIPSNAGVSAAGIVTELEKRGIRRLFVEGGAQVLRMFLQERMADRLRLAVNPTLRLGTERGGAHFVFEAPASTPCKRERFGSMEATTWELRPAPTSEDRQRLRTAIAESRKCEPCATSYCVGAVVATPDGRTFCGYTHETSTTHHAEQEAIAKALAAGAQLRGATIYTSMEPCSKRASEPESCTELILRHGFARVFFALYEPDRFVCCRGAQTLREAGVEVTYCPELAEEVRTANAHLWR